MRRTLAIDGEMSSAVRLTSDVFPYWDYAALRDCNDEDVDALFWVEGRFRWPRRADVQRSEKRGLA